MYIRTSFVCSSLRVSSIRIYILIDGLLTNNSTNTLLILDLNQLHVILWQIRDC